ncbi:MAG: hypothetical protein J5697_01935 [Clostridia bacterium]|nr:hypothetical protein [Clostridia bacterium]
MADRTSSLSSVSAFFGTDVLFIFFTAVIAVCFSADLFLSIFRAGYGLKKRLWFLFLSGGVSALSFSFFGGREYAFFYLGLGLIFSVFLFVVREKKRKVTQEERNFIDYVDEEILKSEEEEFKEPKPTKKPKAKKERDPDFTHVKSVIKRLSAMDLSQTDRREIREFESVIYQAEKSGAYSMLKEKINDGLGLLLKLMAKYGA